PVADGNSAHRYTDSFPTRRSSDLTQAALVLSTSDVSRAYNGTLGAAGTAVVTGGTLYSNASNGNAADTLSGGSFAYLNANAGAKNRVSTRLDTMPGHNSGDDYSVS